MSFALYKPADSCIQPGENRLSPRALSLPPILTARSGYHSFPERIFPHRCRHLPSFPNRHRPQVVTLVHRSVPHVDLSVPRLRRARAPIIKLCHALVADLVRRGRRRRRQVVAPQGDLADDLAVVVVVGAGEFGHFRVVGVDAAVRVAIEDRRVTRDDLDMYQKSEISEGIGKSIGGGERGPPVRTYVANDARREFFEEAEYFHPFVVVGLAVVDHGVKFLLEVGEHFRARLEHTDDRLIGFQQEFGKLGENGGPLRNIGSLVRCPHEDDADGGIEHRFRLHLRSAARYEQSLEKSHHPSSAEKLMTGLAQLPAHLDYVR